MLGDESCLDAKDCNLQPKLYRSVEVAALEKVQQFMAAARNKKRSLSDSKIIIEDIREYDDKSSMSNHDSNDKCSEEPLEEEKNHKSLAKDHEVSQSVAISNNKPCTSPASSDGSSEESSSIFGESKSEDLSAWDGAGRMYFNAKFDAASPQVNLKADVDQLSPE